VSETSSISYLQPAAVFKPVLLCPSKPFNSGAYPVLSDCLLGKKFCIGKRVVLIVKSVILNSILILLMLHNLLCEVIAGRQHVVVT
jgi:hypothetical protein